MYAHERHFVSKDTPAKYTPHRNAHEAGLADGASLPREQSLEITTYTAPRDSGSPPSINDSDDIAASARAVWKHVCDQDALQGHDAVLVACYSAHPLVHEIAAAHPHVAVAGIFEASVTAALPLLRRADTGRGGGGGWGIVTTGQFWEAHLDGAVRAFLGQRADDANSCFRGVFSTGLNASDFHGGVSPDTMRDRLADATRRLLRKGAVDCVLLGCAGMAGLEGIIRSVAREVYGEQAGDRVYIIDGIRAGVGVLEQMVRNRHMFLPC